jgi:hypothetical protein
MRIRNTATMWTVQVLYIPVPNTVKSVSQYPDFGKLDPDNCALKKETVMAYFYLLKPDDMF